MRTYTYHKTKFRAHPGCAAGFKEDRRHGLNYGLHRVELEDGRTHTCMDREEFSRLTNTCAYCGEGG